MKALKTKVILSGIVLVFAFIATIGTTFAWFTISETVAVDGINLQVTSSDNLLIRVDTGTDFDTPDAFGSSAVTTIANYQSSLALTDITADKYAGLGTWRMSPVTAIQSTYDAIDAKTLNTIDDSYDTRNLSLSALKNTTTGGYIELHFWLYSQASDTRPVELVTTSITATSGTTQLDAVENAVRFGIWMNDNDAANANGVAAGNAFIYGNDDDYGFEFLVGQSGYSDGYLFNTLNDAASTSDLAAAYVSYTDGTTNNALVPMTDGSDQLLATVTGYDRVLLLAGNLNTTDIYNIVPGVPTLVTVRIFIEGFDAQATNAIVNAAFDLSLGFSFGTTDV
jgi:hypothetical protein